MKRIVLLGDSIRLGYAPAVRQRLADLAHIISPAENGQHTVHLLLNFYSWVVVHQPDVIHLNAGLWDMRRVVRGVAGNVVELDDYRRNVRRLIELAQRHTGAKVIWATTTPVNHDASNQTHIRNGLPGRDGADVPRYNAAAVEVAGAAGAQVNDLHGAVVEAGSERLLSDDGTHFTPEGYELLGARVAAALRAAL